MMNGLFAPAPVPNHERNLAPPKRVPGSISAGSVRVASGSGFRYVVPFPFRLHEMLCNVESKYNSLFVSWLPDGKHFKIHDPRRFLEVVIPSAFKQKSLKSFQRQLHLYGFQRVHEGPTKGAYFHEKFLRDHRDLCLAICRTKSPKKKSRVAIPTKDNDPSKKSISHSRKKNFGTNNTGKKISVTSKFSTIVNFNGILESQSSQTSENNIYSLKRPRNKHAYSNIYIDDNSSVTPNKIESSDLIDSNKHAFFDTGLHHEDSIEEWLIKNGLPISVFHPLAIDKISDSSCDVPRSASSNITATVIHCQNTIPQAAKVHPSYEIATKKEPQTQLQNYVTDLPTLFQGLPCPNNTNSMMIVSSNLLNDDEVLSGGSRISSSVGETMIKTKQTSMEAKSINMVSVQPNFQMESFVNRSNSADRDDDPLRTDLLPGEILPSIDDALWAL